MNFHSISILNGSNFLVRRLSPNIAESLITYPNATNAGVSTREFVISYNIPAAIDIVTTL
jgi:hypothetical protein